jgi:hypothetical protein
VVERGPEKAGVGGSIPSLATTLFNHLQINLMGAWENVTRIWIFARSLLFP